MPLAKNKISKDALKPGSYTTLGFRAAEYTRSSGQKIGPYSSGADVHVIQDRETLVAQSQALYRDNGIYKGVVNRIVDNVLGGGSTLMSKSGNDDTNATLERLWKAFWNSRPEVRNLFDGRKVERLVMAAYIVDGDHGAVKTNLKKLQLTEADLIYTPALEFGKNAIIQGVEIGEFGDPVAFYRCRFDRYGYRRIQPKRILAQDFVYIANHERASQTRGIPLLTASFPNIHRFNDICDSEAVAWQLLSKLAIAVMKKGETTTATTLSEVDTTRTSTGAGDLALRTQEIEDGTIFHGEVGDTIEGIDRNIPGPNFTASATMYLRLIGLPVGIPLELLLLDWSKTNYSSARAALEQFFVMIIGLQAQIKYFLSEVYKWKVAEWIENSDVEATEDIFEHDWILPSSPWVDQLKESQAQGEQLDRGLTTHGEALKSLNRTREDYVETRVREVTDSIEKAEAINQAHPGANVDWRIFAGYKPLGTTSDLHSDTPDSPDAQTPDPQTPDPQAPDPQTPDPQAPDKKDGGAK